MDELIAVTDVRHVRDFALWLRFSDRAAGEVDLAGHLHGRVFEPLADPRFFSQVRVDPNCRPSRGQTGPTWRLSSFTNCGVPAQPHNESELLNGIVTH